MLDTEYRLAAHRLATSYGERLLSSCAPSEPVSSNSPESGPLRVLLVEDNPGDARLVELMLGEELPQAYALTHAQSLSAALIALRGERFDAVLLDLGLPDADGADIVFEVQSLVPDMPLLVLSGSPDEELAMRLVQAGVQDFITKGQGDGQQLSRAVRYAIRRKQAEVRLRSLAQHDPLTGLANRALFEDRLDRAIARAKRSRTPLALIFLDLDRFKLINDTLGHDVGDGLLSAVGERLLDCVRESDTVARLGGDEFTVVLEDVKHTQGAVTVAEKILEAIEQPFSIDGSEIHTTTSVGIAMYPDCGEDATTLARTIHEWDSNRSH